MRSTLRIARIELASLFYSPIAWLLLILFLVQVSFGYVGKIETMNLRDELGFGNSSLTFKIFSSPQTRGIFISSVLQNLYLYIPLITMGLISRETSSGTIKLLYSSPIKLSEIVLGKYMAMLVFNLVMILMLLIIVVIASFHVENLDFGMIFSALFGIYLLLSAYAAIGLFMSCLSTYQVVAAIATFAVFALLQFVGTLWQQYDVLRDITGYLSISGRTESMVMGLVNTRDILYYLLITAMFLAFAWLKLRGSRRSVSWNRNLLNYGGVLAVVLIVGFLTSRPGYIGYWDTTYTRQNTISKNTQDILKEIGNDPLKVTTYVNLIDNTYFRGQPKSRNADKRRWERYQRFKPNIHVDYVYYYDSVLTDPRFYNRNKDMTIDEIAQKYAKTFKIGLDRFKTPEEIQKEINLYPEYNRLVMLLDFKDKSTFLRTFNDQEFWPSETEVAAALKRMTVPLPRIAFLQGEEERSIDKMGDRHYKLATSEPNVRASLMNQGFDSESLTLSGDEQIPEGITALVIADPRAHFDSGVLDKIIKYIDEGGNLLLAGEPGKQDVLNPILSRLGVQLMDGTLVQGDINFAPDEIRSFVTEFGEEGFGRKVANLFEQKLAVNTPGSVGLSYVKNSDFDIHPLLMTDGEQSWNKTGKLVLDSADIVFNPAAGDVKQANPTALALTRQVNGKEQRILVTGDADFLSNAALAKSYPQNGNGRFFQGFLGWFSYGEFPIEPTWPEPNDNELKVNSDRIYLIKWLMLGIIPGLLLTLGTIILIRRKRK